MKSEIDIFSRHSIRSDGEMGLGNLKPEDRPSERFAALTEEGEEKAREIARNEYSEIIEKKMEENGVLFLGGSSEGNRTKETAVVIGDEVSKLYQGRQDILILNKDVIAELKEDAKKERGKVLDKIERIIKNNPDKKIIIVYPLFLKEFSLRPLFREEKTGEHTDFSKNIFSKAGHDEQAGAIEWLKKEENQKEGESAKDVSSKHVQGIRRLRQFARKISHDRQLCTGFVGHGWNLDALALYYANGGKIDREAFKELFNDQVIEQAETGWVELKDGKTALHYKEKIFKNE